MKAKWLAVLLALVMVVSMLPVAALAAGSALPFTDVKADDWYAESLQKVYDLGLIKGVSDTEFGPNVTITRGMIVTILFRLEGQPADVEGAKTFSDVAAGAYYADAVAWASASEIVKGYPDGTFLPDEPITREQMAAIFYRYAQSKGEGFTGTWMFRLDFPDAADVSEWADEAMHWMVMKGVINGMDGKLNPQGSATRAQAVTMLSRLLDTLEAETELTVTFDENYSGGKKTEVKVKAGETVKAPTEPTRPNYTFQGWFTEATGGVKFDFTMTITEDITLYAHWATTGSSGGGGGGGGGDIPGPSGSDVSDVDVYKTEPDTENPVAFVYGIGDDTNAVTFTDADGYEISLDTNSKLQVEITKGSAVDASEVVGDDAAKADAVKAVASALNIEITEKNKAALEEAVESTAKYTTVDVEMSMVKTEDGKTTETEIHPVGATAVLLSKEQLGLPADADLSLYTFFADHTNIKGENEKVPGEVKGDSVLFVVNGLSRIVIGNVPPLTVTFDTDGGTPVPEPQKVKLGGFVTPVEPPYKEGSLFIGWDFDIRETNIIRDTTIKALYVEGQVVTEEQITVTWTPSEPAAADVTQAYSNGTLTFTVKAESLTPSLKGKVSITAPAYDTPAAKYVMENSAEAAAASTKYNDLIAGGTSVEGEFSDGTGKPLTSTANLYIKWVDADGNALGLQSLYLIVKLDGQKPVIGYDTKTTSKTVAVDRGIGTWEVYLTDGKNADGGAIVDYVGYLNGYLNTRWSNNERSYYLYLYSNFSNTFSGSISGGNYKTIRAEITPFEGESFTAAPTATGYYYDGNQKVDVNFTATLSGGKAILTAARPTLDGSSVTLYCTVTSGEVTQEVRIYIHTSKSGNDSASCETWEEAVAEVKKGTSYVNYYGEANVTLTDALTLEPGQQLYIQKASFTVGNGGVLTLKGNDSSGANFNLGSQNAVFTIAKGGKLTTNDQSNQSTRYYNNVSAYQGMIVVEDGGTIVIPTNGLIELQASNGSISLEEGCVVTGAENSVFEVYTNDGTIALDGDFTLNGNFYSYGTTTIGAEAALTVADYAYVNGKVTNYGTITQTAGNFNLNGRFDNHGTVKLTKGEGTDYCQMSLNNNGYTDVNAADGAIVIGEGCNLYVNGCVLLNSGSITGAGTLYLNANATASEYDSGIEYAERDTAKDYGPDNYDRYKFVRDPEATAEELTFYAELDNQGTCTVTVYDPTQLQ